MDIPPGNIFREHVPLSQPELIHPFILHSSLLCWEGHMLRKKSAPVIPRFPRCRLGKWPESKTKTEILQQVVLITLNNLRSNQQSFIHLAQLSGSSQIHCSKTEGTVGDNILTADVHHTTPVCQGSTSGLHQRCIAWHLHVC